jgi:outer membrane receptor protein involved in Fe transport
VTPQERGSLFSKANYKINDYAEVYGSVIYNRTTSASQQASLPFDSTVDDVTISKDSLYNPFGSDFGGISGVNPDAEYRLLGLGPRYFTTASTTVESNFGVKGNVLDTGWTYDLFSQYGQLIQDNRVQGYFFSNKLQQAVGPSMLVGGVPTCVGTPGVAASAIAGCTPINIFAVNDPSVSDPAQQAAFQGISTNFNTQHTYVTKDFALDLNGKVISLPAGDLQAAVGVDHRWQEGVFIADQIVQGQPPYGITCQISSETCTGNSRLHYSNTDLYGELFAPLLKDLPLVKSLNIDLGIRWSDYTDFSSTTKGQVKIEYRPITDLLFRSTFTQIYRAPTVYDLASAPLSSSTAFVDPCDNLTAAMVAANPNYAKACFGVPLDGSFHDKNAQTNGVLQSNPNLKPEQGEVVTGGFVWDPSFLPGFSATADYWHYTITNVLTQLDPTFSSDQCIATGADAYCNLAVRYGPTTGSNAGQILAYLQPTSNVGTLKTDGLDLGMKYSINSTPIGSFHSSIDITHVNSYVNDPGAGSPAVQYVGTFSKQFGNEMRWRGLMSVSWGFAGFSALVTEQWLGKSTITDGEQNIGADIHIGNVYYTNLTVGYDLPTNTHIQAGLTNVFNRQPPLYFSNNVTNANVDVNTYDVLGRRWFAGFTQKF